MGVFHTHTISSEALSMLVIRLPPPYPPRRRRAQKAMLMPCEKPRTPSGLHFTPGGNVDPREARSLPPQDALGPPTVLRKGGRE